MDLLSWGRHGCRLFDCDTRMYHQENKGFLPTFDPSKVGRTEGLSCKMAKTR